MKKITLFLPLLVLIFALSACSAIGDTLAATFESGSIHFVTSGTKYHNDESDAPIVAVSLYSSFESEKTATIVIQGSSYQCLLAPQAISECAGVRLPQPGVYSLTASVSKLNGGQVNAIPMNVEWTPYSWLDKMAQSLAGGEGKDPTLGYIFGSLLLMVLFVITMTILTKGSSVGAFIGFFTSLLVIDGLYLATNSVGAALIVFGGTIVLAVIGILAAMFFHSTSNGNALVLGTKVEHTRFDKNGRLERKVAQVPVFAGPSQDSPRLPTPSGNPTRQITATKQEIYGDEQ